MSWLNKTFHFNFLSSSPLESSSASILSGSYADFFCSKTFQFEWLQVRPHIIFRCRSVREAEGAQLSLATSESAQLLFCEYKQNCRKMNEKIIKNLLKFVVNSLNCDHFSLNCDQLSVFFDRPYFFHELVEISVTTFFQNPDRVFFGFGQNKRSIVFFYVLTGNRA